MKKGTKEMDLTSVYGGEFKGKCKGTMKQITANEYET